MIATAEARCAATLPNALAGWPNGGMKLRRQDIRSAHDVAKMAAIVRPEDFGREILPKPTP